MGWFGVIKVAGRLGTGRKLLDVVDGEAAGEGCEDPTCLTELVISLF